MALRHALSLPYERVDSVPKQACSGADSDMQIVDDVMTKVDVSNVEDSVDTQRPVSGPLL
jgi:hypothetical protein